jgi:hypothetical protein
MDYKNISGELCDYNSKISWCINIISDRIYEHYKFNIKFIKDKTTDHFNLKIYQEYLRTIKSWTEDMITNECVEMFKFNRNPLGADIVNFVDSIIVEMFKKDGFNYVNHGIKFRQILYN